MFKNFHEYQEFKGAHMMSKAYQVEKKGKLSWIVIRQMPHDPQYGVGSKIPGYGVVVAVRS